MLVTELYLRSYRDCLLLKIIKPIQHVCSCGVVVRQVFGQLKWLIIFYWFSIILSTYKWYISYLYLWQLRKKNNILQRPANTQITVHQKQN